MSEKIKILVPLDFSEHSLNPWPSAQNIAKTYDAEIYLMHALEAPTGPMRLLSGFDEAEARKKALAMMDDFIAKHGDASITYNKMVKVGKPYRKIIEAANELNANAIVMGTHGASGMQELLVGTNAARVIRTAPCPVITIREKPTNNSFKKILVPLDLTKETGEKLELAIEFAKNFGASLVVCSVLLNNDEDIKRRLLNRMTMAVNHVRKQDVEVESKMLQSKGKIGDLVIGYGQEIGADLICIMTQQELDFHHTFIGSNASAVVNHSPIPVMSIKPKREYRSSSYSGSHFG